MCTGTTDGAFVHLCAKSFSGNIFTRSSEVNLYYMVQIFHMQLIRTFN